MIQFEGPLTGEAATRYFKKARSFERNIVLAAVGVTEAIWLMFTYGTALFEHSVRSMILLFGLILLCSLIPVSKKDREQNMIMSVFVDGKEIVVTTAKKTICCPIANVKEVQDCKTYYEIIPVWQKTGFLCICQKDRLSKGTLEQFERLFEGKLTDMTEYFE